MSSAPHLPPKTCSIQSRKRTQALPWFLGMVVIALLSGMATSLLVVAWFYPQLIPDAGVSGIRPLQQSLLALDEDVQRTVAERQVLFYDVDEKRDETFYTDQAQVAMGMVLSSDGWVVLPTPAGVVPVADAWEAIDGQGIVHEIIDVVPHPSGSFAYVRIDGEGFRVSSLSPWNETMSEQQIWRLSDRQEWRIVQPDVESLDSRDRYTMQDRLFTYALKEGGVAGDMLFSQTGSLVGFVGDNGVILPAWLFAVDLPRVLAGEELDVQGFPYTGTLITDRVVGEQRESFIGFYVETSPTQPTTSTIGVGDVIVRIQQQEIMPAALAQQVYAAPKETRFTIYREGREFDITVLKETIK